MAQSENSLTGDDMTILARERADEDIRWQARLQAAAVAPLVSTQEVLDYAHREERAPAALLGLVQAPPKFAGGPNTMVALLEGDNARTEPPSGLWPVAAPTLLAEGDAAAKREDERRLARLELLAAITLMLDSGHLEDDPASACLLEGVRMYLRAEEDDAIAPGVF